MARFYVSMTHPAENPPAQFYQVEVEAICTSEALAIAGEQAHARFGQWPKNMRATVLSSAPING